VIYCKKVERILLAGFKTAAKGFKIAAKGFGY
jgi:hypothetical protein